MKNLLLTIIFGFSAFASFSQGILRGFVYEESSGAAIPFANVAVVEAKVGTVSDFNGFYQINDLPKGVYTVTYSFVGYETVSQKVTIEDNKIFSKKVYLKESSEILNDINLSGEKQKAKVEVLTSVTTLNPKTIEQFSVGGDPDIIKAIQVVPGVVTTGDQGGQLYIRGGAPIQNLVQLDGMIVYNPFHSIGFFSVFDTDILQSADVHTAGFNAEYGSRTSSVMDIKTRPGNTKRFAGKVSTSTYMSKVLFEGPIGKKNDKGIANSSFLVSAKHSYLEQTSKVLYPYAETEYDGLPFSFTDVYGKYTFQSKGGSQLNLFGFSFSDGVQFGGDKSINWNSKGYGADFTIVPPSSATLIRGNLAFSDYVINSSEIPGQPRESSISGFNGGLDFTYFLRKSDEVRYGFQAIGYATDLLLTNEVGTKIRQNENTTEMAGYVTYRFVSNRWVVNPGFRMHYYGSIGEFSMEPRLGFKFKLNEKMRVKASGGLYSQNLVAANSDRDVVNLFYGFLSGPTNLPSKFRDEQVTGKLQRAQHGVLGFEYDVLDNLTMNLEGYVKYFYPISNINRNKLYEDIPAYNDKPELLRKDFIVEEGLARGIDFSLKYTTNRIYIWAVYSYTKVTRDDGVQVYSPHFDRNHNVNLVASYKLGKKLDWEISTRYNFGSGFPFTQQQGFYPSMSFTDGSGRPNLDYDYTSQNGQLTINYGELNKGRLPNYHRVDLTVKKHFELSKNSDLDVSVAATNVLNRENIFYFDRVDAKRVNQLPIMPTLIVSWGF